MSGTCEESHSTSASIAASGGHRAAAFFDLDGTLVVGQTTLLLIRFLRKVGVVSRRFLVGTTLWFLGYKLGVVKVTERSRHQGARVFAGRTVEEVQALMDRLTGEVLVPRLHPVSRRPCGGHIRGFGAGGTGRLSAPSGGRLFGDGM
jgi:hypothetical protein